MQYLHFFITDEFYAGLFISLISLVFSLAGVVVCKVKNCLYKKEGTCSRKSQNFSLTSS